MLVSSFAISFLVLNNISQPGQPKNTGVNGGPRTSFGNFPLSLPLFALFFHTGFGFIPVIPFKLAFEVTVKTFSTFPLSKALLGMPAHFFFLFFFPFMKTLHYFPQRHQWASKELWLLQEPMSQNGLSSHWVTERCFVLNHSAYEQSVGNRFAGCGWGLKTSAVMIGCMLACLVRKSS